MSTECKKEDILRAAIERLMDAWIRPAGEPPRSMHELKIDMDDAYKQAEQALKKDPE